MVEGIDKARFHMDFLEELIKTGNPLIRRLAFELHRSYKEIDWHNKHWEILQRDYDISQAQLLDEEDIELEEWPDGKP